jgi:hypothetical protein
MDRKELSEYSKKEYVDNWLDKLKEKCKLTEGMKVLEICQAYPDSAEMELEDEEMLKLVGWLMKTIRGLPYSLNVLEQMTSFFQF